MKTFRLHFRTLDEPAILKAAAEMLVRTKSRQTLEEATGDIDGDVDNALRLLLDQAIVESPAGDLIEIQDTSCETS